MVDRVESYLPPPLPTTFQFPVYIIHLLYAKISTDMYFDIATSMDVKHVFHTIQSKYPIDM